MSTTTTNANAFKVALVAAIRSVVDPAVLVTYGHPGMANEADMIGVSRVTSTQAVATLGTNRSREETLTVEVQISCYRRGGVEQELVAGAQAYALLGLIERQVRMVDTTVGGTVRQCFLTSHEADGETDPVELAEGRCIEIVATFTAQARISA
jgi:hypothetical protein